MRGPGNVGSRAVTGQAIKFDCPTGRKSLRYFDDWVGHDV